PTRMSAFGTKRTSKRRPAMSAFGGKADIAFEYENVCFWHKADMSARTEFQAGGCGRIETDRSPMRWPCSSRGYYGRRFNPELHDKFWAGAPRGTRRFAPRLGT